MRGIARVAAALVLVATGAACTGVDVASTPPGTEASTPPAGTDVSLREAALDVVERREQALVSGDRDAFLATVDEDELTFAATQARWFDNLARLPVTDLSLTLGDEDDMSRVHGEGALQLPVELTMRLDGFDRHPVTQPLVYTFNRDGDDAVLADDRNVQNDAAHGWLPAPWDITRIEVRRQGPVLGIFDEETVAYADSVMADLAEARALVRAAVPGWSGRFVAYDIEDLQALEQMTHMRTWQTGGVAFPVLERPGSRRVASYRFMVNPDVAESYWQRPFLFRHELVHVALGGSDAASPVWLREGIAEQVSRSVLPTSDRRRIAAIALSRARPGLRLEPGVDFYRRVPALHYELAAVACDFLATTQGREVLWELRDAFAAEPASSAAQVSAVVRRVTGLGTGELAARARIWALTG
ncbi:DcrB/PsbP domain-containing protein [Nocardioides sediminis]|uniref:hypothetical protein n=1 Tax=Nocardioides sediminis TaxID=433648 RepID=UPI00131EFB4E|nr:hypothetical protein [Nocardioides sediminis]